MEAYALSKIDKKIFDKMTEEEKDEYMAIMVKEFIHEMNTAMVSKFLPVEYVASVRTFFIFCYKHYPSSYVSCSVPLFIFCMSKLKAGVKNTKKNCEVKSSKKKVITWMNSVLN